jgi:hypothetical protein
MGSICCHKSSYESAYPIEIKGYTEELDELASRSADPLKPRSKYKFQTVSLNKKVSSEGNGL